MQAVKNTIAENLGKVVSRAHSLAPEDSKFSLDQVPDLAGKVAVVTGGSEGIGYGVTHTLLTHNISKLFILSLDSDIASDAITAIKSKLGEETAKRVVWLHCDLSDWTSTRQTAYSLAAQTDRLDILVNNAARGIMTAELAANGVDLHMATNHIGHAVLTASLLPLLLSTANKNHTVRIVNLSSNLHSQAPSSTKFANTEELNHDHGPQNQYARSKLATLLFSKYLARHLTPRYPTILANATHPGIVDTRQSSEHIHEAYPFLGYGMSVGMKMFKKTQFEGAVSTCWAATVTQGTGEYVCPPAIVERGSAMANDSGLAERLMDLTWKVVREKGLDVGEGCPFKEC